MDMASANQRDDALEIAQLRAQLEETVARLDQRDALIELLNERIIDLEEHVEKVRREGKRQAAPFSKGKSGGDPARPGRKGGGTDGKHNFRRPPDSEPDRVIPVLMPLLCPCCGSPDVEFDKDVSQWTEDVPPPTTIITRFDIEVGHCNNCDSRIQPRHGEQTSDATGAASSMLGPRSLALAAELHYVLGLSFGKVARHLRRLGIEVTASGVTQALARLGRKGTPTYEELKHYIASAPVVSPDETGWRIGGDKAWLWAFATPEVTVYAISKGRGFKDAIMVLGKDYEGTLCRDGWAPYRRFTKASHQTCIAHLLRRCKGLIESLPEEHCFIPTHVKDILGASLAFRDARDEGQLTQDELKDAIEVLRHRLDVLIATTTTNDQVRKLLKHLGIERDAMFTFLSDSAVDATNWRSEQAIRPAVVNRKVWGGNRTHKGARTAEVIITLARSAAQQGADAVAIFMDLLLSPSPIVAKLIPDTAAGP
jgi:transposase